MTGDDLEIERAIEIEDVAHGGDGVGRLSDGRVVFVPRTLPGEVVDVEVVDQAERFARGRALSVERASENRVEPDCPYYRQCGGCQFWHVEYDREVELKARAARELVERNAELELPEPEIHPAPSPREYRSRAKFHRRQAGDDGDWTVGFFAPQSSEVVEVENCPVAREPINAARRRIAGALEGVGPVELRIETASDRQAVVSIEPGEDAPDDPPDSLVDFAEALEPNGPIRGVRFVGDDRDWIGGDATVDGDQVMADAPVESIRLPAGLFRQANPEVNRMLVDRVCRAAEAFGSERVLELFCGVGNFTFPLGDHVDAILGVEGSDVAVEMAQTMAEFTLREEIAFAEADLSGGIADLEFAADFPADTALLDPPRGGAAPVCEDLVRSEIRHIIYVSCDPGALGRDLAILSDGPWQAQWFEMFDMFPRTAHVEVCMGLSRTDG